MSEFIPHAVERFYERTDQDVTRNQIVKAIENGNIVYAKRLTSSRSLAYVIVGKNAIKIIIAKSTKKVLSVIPWKSVFKEVIKLNLPTKDPGKTYEVTVFPDCYLETGTSHALTKINRIHDDGAREPIPHNHPYFEILFNLAWDKVINSEKHNTIVKERETGNEKIKTQVHREDATAAY